MTIKGEVIKGNQIGSKIGFPTANLKVLKPLGIEGVYAAKAKINNINYKAILHIGARPTFNDDLSRIELHILDFDKDIYGKNVEVEILSKIRALRKFKTVEKLKTQIVKDIVKVRSLI